MDLPTDPLARQLAVTALTTEHFNLQSARMGTIAEANGRATLYLGTLSSSVIAITFVGQANQLGDTFYRFALTLGLDPAVASYFPPTDPQGMTKLERVGVVATGPLQLLLTAASMVACIDAIVGGVAVALAVRALLEAVVPELFEGASPGLPGWTGPGG